MREKVLHVAGCQCQTFAFLFLNALPKAEGGEFEACARSAFSFADSSGHGPWQFYRHCGETSSSPARRDNNLIQPSPREHLLDPPSPKSTFEMKTRVARIWAEQLLSGGSQSMRSSVSRPSAPFLRSFFSSTQPPARTHLLPKTFQQSALLYLRFQRSALARRFRSVRFNSSNSKSNGSHHDPTPHLGSPEPAQTLSQKLKALSKEYGWAALGVYLGLSALDFPFCFLAVRLLGTDRIGHYEEVVKDGFWNIVRLVIPDAGTTSAEKHAHEETAQATLREGSLDATEIAAVKARNGGDACELKLDNSLEPLADRVKQSGHSLGWLTSYTSP